MKLNQTAVLAAAIAGVFAAGTVASKAITLTNTKPAAEKDSCSGKDGCQGKDKKKDKDNCTSKDKKKDGQIL